MFAIAEEPDGTLWFGTRGGLSRFTKVRFRTYTRKDGMPNDDVRCLHTAQGGGVWVGQRRRTGKVQGRDLRVA